MIEDKYADGVEAGDIYENLCNDLCDFDCEIDHGIVEVVYVTEKSVVIVDEEDRCTSYGRLGYFLHYHAPIKETK